MNRSGLLYALALASLVTGCASGGPMVRHIVLFKYKDSVSPQQIEEANKAFAALQHKIPGIVHFEAGEDNSPEGKSKGLTHAYILTFKDIEARDTYLPHPEHKKFGGMIGPMLADVCVVDFSLE